MIWRLNKLALVYLVGTGLFLFFELSQLADMRKVNGQISESYELISGNDIGIRFELEYRRFISTTESYVMGHDEVTHGDVLRWFDIFWSRAHSPTIKKYVTDGHVDGIALTGIDLDAAKLQLEDLKLVMKKLDPLVQTLTPADYDSFEKIQIEFGAFDDTITKLANATSVARVDAARALEENLTSAVSGLDTSLLVSIVTSFLVLSMLGIDTYRARKDAKEIRKREASVRFLAEHDVLTGLGNRAFLNSKIDQFTKLNSATQTSFNLVLVDLDDFKQVNDIFGHVKGDKLLKEAAKRISNIFNEKDIVVRLGGDEFAVLFEADARDVEQIINSVVTAMNSSFFVDNQEFNLSASIGVTQFPELSHRADNLMRDADLALYSVKNTGGNGFAFFKDSMIEELQHRMSLEADMRNFLNGEDKGFEVFYQPQLSLTGDQRAACTIIGVEALARWFHPEHGFIPPPEFIAIAESSGMIDELSNWITRQACEDAALWHRAGYDIQLAVNVSPHQLNNEQLPQEIFGILNDTGLSKEKFTLEITENSAVQGMETALGILQELHAGGVALAMDDFGTGYSNLSYIKDLPLDYLKIDRSFVMHMEEREEDRKLVQGIIHLAHGMGLKVVAEGLETQSQLEFLHRHDCDTGQGYFFERPMSNLKLLSLLERENAEFDLQPQAKHQANSN